MATNRHSDSTTALVATLRGSCCRAWARAAPTMMTPRPTEAIGVSTERTPSDHGTISPTAPSSSAAAMNLMNGKLYAPHPGLTGLDHACLRLQALVRP
jgi:hypothetical protein